MTTGETLASKSPAVSTDKNHDAVEPLPRRRPEPWKPGVNRNEALMVKQFFASRDAFISNAERQPFQRPDLSDLPLGVADADGSGPPTRTVSAAAIPRLASMHGWPCTGSGE